MLAPIEQLEHLVRMLPLAALARSRYDLEIRLILSHQRNRKTRESTTQQHQCHCHTQVCPQVRVVRRLGQILILPYSHIS